MADRWLIDRETIDSRQIDRERSDNHPSGSHPVGQDPFGDQMILSQGSCIPNDYITSPNSNKITEMKKQ